MICSVCFIDVLWDAYEFVYQLTRSRFSQWRVMRRFEQPICRHLCTGDTRLPLPIALATEFAVESQGPQRPKVSALEWAKAFHL